MNMGGGKVVGSGGSSPSLNVPVSAANPLGAFPGNTLTTVIPGQYNLGAGQVDQLVTSGLRNSAPTLATITGILTDPNFRVVLHALEQRTGTETLAEPEVTTISGRQTQMRATQILTIITSYSLQQAVGGGTTGGTTTTTTTP
jgi:general secretion pathway protein D